MPISPPLLKILLNNAPPFSGGAEINANLIDHSNKEE